MKVEMAEQESSSSSSSLNRYSKDLQADLNNNEGKSVEELFKYLNNFKDLNDLNKDDRAFGAIRIIRSEILNKKKQENTIQLSFKHNFTQILLTILKNERERLSNVLNINTMNHQLACDNKENKNYLKTFGFSYLCIGIVRQLSNKSARFCLDFVESNGIETLLGYLKLEPLIEAYIKLDKELYGKEAKKPTKDDDPEYKYKSKSRKGLCDSIDCLIRGSIGSMLNLSRVYDTTKSKWKKEETDLVNFLLMLVDKLKDTNDCEMAINMLIAFIADENEIKALGDMSGSKPIQTIVNLIRKLCSTLSKGEKAIKRISIQLNETDKSENCMIAATITKRRTMWHCVELLNALYHMAICDEIKMEIYEKQNMKEYLRVIISNGNEIEQEYSIKLLWQLCFDKKIAHHVTDDDLLMRKLEQLRDLKGQNVESLKNVCHGILWQCENALKVLKVKQWEFALKDEEKPWEIALKDKEVRTMPNRSISHIEKEKHIMISYNRDAREICLNIKKELEKQGLNIWIDVESMHGSSLESMANAVEKSMCVLMCMTEKYKQSPFCRGN
jgi:hypothetical protein